MADEAMDIFIFLGFAEGDAERIHRTGRTARNDPPLWSFGTWMSRITYFSEAEGRDVARKLRENKIPSRRHPLRYRLVRRGLAVRLRLCRRPLRQSPADAHRPKVTRLPHLPLATPLLHSEKPSSPRAGGTRSDTYATVRGQLPLRGRGAGLHQPRNREVVSGKISAI